jgi:diguanylate cyclase (GGDEF)-like protein
VLSLLREGRHLLITTYDGVYRYDLESHALNHFDHVPGDPGSLPSDAVRKTVRIGDALWYLTSGGISIAGDVLQSDRFDNLLHRADDAASLPQNTASAAVLDRKNRVWVGTFGGLGLLDPYSAAGPYRFRTLDTADGLPSNKINAVVDDDHGNIWLSTSVGLARVDGDSLAIHTLGLRDGLHIFSYIYTAASRTPHGELLFGGLGGLTVVRPDWQPPATTMAPLAITRAVIDGNELPYGRLPGSDGSVTLEHSRSLRVDFALLDYQPAAATSYAYRMQGFDETWNAIPAGSPPTAIYTNLPYGSYRLQLRATTRGMQPRTAETSLAVEVAPHWYETWAARIAAVLAAIFLVYLLTQLRTTYLRRQAAQLQQQVEAHTSELRVANARLDRLASTDELTGVLNRRRFMELAEQVCTEHHDGNACIALFDLDHFKRINDGFGHMAGDVALRDAAAVMRQHCRAGDLLGRFGGEEFVLCLPGTAPPQAIAICERIRATLAASPIEHGGRRIALTTSAGITPLHAGESLNLWLSRADKALYRAKSQGRNRCVEMA